MKILKYLIPAVLTVALIACDTEERQESSKRVTVDGEQTADIQPDAPVKHAALNFADLKSPVNFGKSYACGNLQVFMLEGKADLNGKKFVPLNEAMAGKMVTLHETGSVNELSIDNNSDEYIFINSGDVVKGGKQDRTIQYDIVLAPGEKNVELASFCVEQNRWTNRGSEDVDAFASNSTMLPSRGLKVAAKYDGDQSKVWSGVAEQKNKLNINLSAAAGAPVNVESQESPSSLQLALESKELGKVEKDIRKCLGNILEDNPNAIGFAYAINGELYGVDIYNNKKLFHDLWDKLISAAIVESIGETNDGEYDKVTKEDIIAATHRVKLHRRPDVKDINPSTKMLNRHSKKGDVFHSGTFDKKEKGAWLHQNYITNDLQSGSTSNVDVQMNMNPVNLPGNR